MIYDVINKTLCGDSVFYKFIIRCVQSSEMPREYKVDAYHKVISSTGYQRPIKSLWPKVRGISNGDNQPRQKA